MVDDGEEAEWWSSDGVMEVVRKERNWLREENVCAARGPAEA